MGFVAPRPFSKFLFIIGLVSFLALLQIIFSPFMRELFLKSLREGFYWTDWQYLLIAIERFAWPLLVVSSFQSKLSDPAIIGQLTTLLSPLSWLGIQIDKLQTMVVLSLRFVPALRLEWQRFSKFQMYFQKGMPGKKLGQKLRFWQAVLRALISHTIHRSIVLGDLLAIRGLPAKPEVKSSNHLIGLSTAWIFLGLILFLVDVKMLIAWSMMTLWMGLVSIARRRVVSL